MKNPPFLRPIMFVGTGSDVGKSIINTAFCRIFKQDGYLPAPFKAQNMSLNSYVTPDGLEMGRAQVAQAEACCIPCQVEMNPVLVKPMSNTSAQVVVNGKPIGVQTAAEYFKNEGRDELFQEVMKSFDALAQKFNPVVIEGAGSISEVNLRDKDITNMRVAVSTEADTYLIADIDKGGVFGSVYGTLELLPKEERALVKGIIINKFRGDMSLFTEGRNIIEKLTGIPVVAVIPYFTDIQIDEEDSVSLSLKHKELSKDKVNVAVVLLHYMSNFTDFNALELVPEINLFYTHEAADLLAADIVIIPGSKNTMGDLYELRKSGLAKAILETHQKGKAVYGVCGGYQMMGAEIYDLHHVEGDIKSMPGLGILPVSTTLSKKKVTLQRSFSFRGKKDHCEGYEIHMGQTRPAAAANCSTVCEFEDGTTDGCFINDKTWGTYVHGIFDNSSVVAEIVAAVSEIKMQEFDVVTFKEEQYDKLANTVREHTDMETIYASLKL